MIWEVVPVHAVLGTSVNERVFSQIQSSMDLENLLLMSYGLSGYLYTNSTSRYICEF